MKWIRSLGLGVAAAGLSIVTMMPASASRREPSPELTVQKLVYGNPDRAWTRPAAELATVDAGFAERLARVAGSEEAGALGRAAAFEALADAGTPAAQTAMRDALATASLRTDPDYAALLLRLGSVRCPTPETVAWLAELHDEAVRAGALQVAAASAPDGGRAAFDGAHGRHARSGAAHQR
jgi:hypothetical protein